eukprot:gene30328-36648_t
MNQGNRSGLSPFRIPLYSHAVGRVAGRPYTILNESVDSLTRTIYLEQLYSARSKLPATQILLSHGPKKLPKLRYIHIPRAGNALMATAVHYCCENIGNITVSSKIRYKTLPWKLDYTCRGCLRQPITNNGEYFSSFPFIHPHDDRIAITMVRNPIERIASQIVEMRSLRGMITSYGISSEDADVLLQVLSNKFTNTFNDFVNYLRRKSSFHAALSLNKPGNLLSKEYEKFLSVVKQCYADVRKVISTKNKHQTTAVVENCRYLSASHFPGIKGCMTRMILGLNCLDTIYSITVEDMLEAKRRLKESFAFVGITSKWNESIAKFHRMYGGNMYLDELSRPPSRHSREKAHVVNILRSANYRDVWDEEIFQHAQKIFSSY